MSSPTRTRRPYDDNGNFTSPRSPLAQQQDVDQFALEDPRAADDGQAASPGVATTLSRFFSGLERRRRYKYHDRGDGMFEAARKAGEHPHLVLTGRHAGRSNVRFVGSYGAQFDAHLWAKDFFTSIVHVPFAWLFFWMLVAYVASYLFWAFVWYFTSVVDESCVDLGGEEGEYRTFLAAYLFSLETQATIGFGVRAVGECGISAVFLTLQNVFGMILDAVCLGVVFAKLSHPKHRGRSIFISECATIARRDGQLKFMFRVADIRGNYSTCDAKVRAFLYTWGPGRDTLEGERIPCKVESMSLSSVDGQLLLPVIVEHTIDERSPLFGQSHDMLAAGSAEVVVSFEAVNDLGDSFQIRRSYLPNEIHWGSTFVPIVHQARRGLLQHVVDLTRFHDVVPQAGMPQLPISALSQYVLSGENMRKPMPRALLCQNTLVLSTCAAMTRRNGQPWLMFRVGDTLPGQMLEVNVRAYLYTWEATSTAEGDHTAYQVEAVPLQYEHGAERPLLRFPEVVRHKIDEDSPLSPWWDAYESGNVSSLPAAEVVVVVEAIMFSTSENMMRSNTYKLPGDVKHMHSFVPMVASTTDRDSTQAVLNWSAFHAVKPTGSAGAASAMPDRNESIEVRGRAMLQALRQAKSAPGAQNSGQVDVEMSAVSPPRATDAAHNSSSEIVPSDGHSGRLTMS